MKAVVAAFNQEKALVGAFSVITNLRMALFEALPPVPQLLVSVVPESCARLRHQPQLAGLVEGVDGLPGDQSQVSTAVT